MNRLVVLVLGAAIVVGAGIGSSINLITSNSGNSNSSLSSGKSQTTSKSANSNQQQATEKNCLADSCLQIPNLTYPAANLSQDVKDSLSQALDNEYKLEAYYQAVMAKFGDVRPFAMVIGAEQQHIAVIKSLFQKYGLTINENTWANKSFEISTFTGACQTSAAYESDTANMYVNLLPKVSNYPDITQVFTSIKDASLNNHLPAFKKCST